MFRWTQLLPECPPELAEALGQTATKTATAACGVASTPTIKRTTSGPAQQPVQAETPSGKPVSKPVVTASTPAQSKKQAQIFSVSLSCHTNVSWLTRAQTHTGPMPPAFYASFPTVGKETHDNMRYYITSVKGFSSGTYHAILDKDLALIGQSHSPRKLDALAAAEAQAKEGKVLPKLKGWDFEDRGNGQAKSANLNISKEKKESTGPAPILTHALAVSENEKARLTWLEWFSEDKKAYVAI